MATPPELRPWMPALGLGLGVAASLLVLRSLPPNDAPGRLLSLGPGLVIVFVPFLLTMAFDTLGWRALLRAAGARASFFVLLRIRLEAEGTGVLLPSAGLVPEMLALRALVVGQRVSVTLGFASLAARRFALIHAHGIVLALGTILLFTSAVSIGSRGLCLVLAIASLVLTGVGRLGPRWLLMPFLAGRAELSLRRVPWPRFRSWAERHRHEVVLSGRTLAKITQGGDARAWTASLAFLLAFFAEAFESFVMLRFLGSPIGFAQVLSFDSAVGLARALAAFVPAGLGVQEAGYAAFLLGAGGPDAAGLVASFVVLKRLKEALYCVLGLALVACGRSSSRDALDDEAARASALRLRLAQPDHPDA